MMAKYGSVENYPNKPGSFGEAMMGVADKLPDELWSLNRCPSCKHPSDAVGSSGHSTMFRCPQCACEWARTDVSGQIHSEKYKRWEDVDRLADVNPADDAPLPDMIDRIGALEQQQESIFNSLVECEDRQDAMSHCIDAHEARLTALEAMVKRIAAHLGIEE